jgi:hypothetical protein
MRELNKPIVGYQVRKITTHIPVNMEKVIVFKVPISNEMEKDNDGHYLTLIHTGRFYSFPVTIG